MRALAAEQATARQQESATLLADVPEDDRPGATHAAAPAVWTSPDGTNRTGDVNAPAGARAGSSLDIWVDRAGRLTDAPLTDSEVSGQGQVLGTLTFLGIVIAAMSGHLLLLCLLERRHHRQWERGWASVEPLWASRFR